MTTRRGTRALAAASALLVGCLVIAGCSGADDAADAAPEVWDSSRLHTISLDIDPEDYAELIATFEETGEKVWISATVTIDGATYENVGIKLKGNSSLFSLSTNPGAPVNSARPETLPWRIRLDKYVDGQDHGGAEEFAVRSNSSVTAFNEAVALDVLDGAGLAATEAIAAGMSVNGSEPTLRLVVENPNTDWMERELGDGFLYKAEVGGDYSYRGAGEGEYGEAWDQEGGEDNLAPLIDFLRFINEADDATFASELGTWLDVDAFATYLAFQAVVNNADDIDGPGNNSYLYWDPAAERMTVVNWDLNLAYGARTDDDSVGDNVLSERFLANPRFEAMYDAELGRLTEELVDSGFAQRSLDAWTQLLLDDATHMVPVATIAEESADLAAALQS